MTISICCCGGQENMPFQFEGCRCLILSGGRTKCFDVQTSCLFGREIFSKCSYLAEDTKQKRVKEAEALAAPVSYTGGSLAAVLG